MIAAPSPSPSPSPPSRSTGIWLYPDGTVDELVDAVVAADTAGVDEIWIADEGVMRDPVVVFAAAAGVTSRVRMGIGITSPMLRHPGAIAATVATLDERSHGRMMLGFGVGGEQSLGPFGLVAERPVALLRDAIETARAVLRREESSSYRVPAHAAPARNVPLYVASRGEQINTLASQYADGVFVSGFAPERVATVLGWARSVRPVRVALYQSVRYRSPAVDDPTSISGTPDELARRVAAMAEHHRPDTIGIALVDGASIPSMMEDALATLRILNAYDDDR